jgi:hypothetical protein
MGVIVMGDKVAPFNSKFNAVGSVNIEGRYLQIVVKGSDEKLYFAFVDDVSDLILGVRKADAKLFEWIEMRRKT